MNNLKGFGVMIKTCIVCGKKFDGKNAQKCCSDQCKKIRKKQTFYLSLHLINAFVEYRIIN